MNKQQQIDTLKREVKDLQKELMKLSERTDEAFQMHVKFNSGLAKFVGADYEIQKEVKETFGGDVIVQNYKFTKKTK